jgi:hypothetical protein
VCRKGEGDYVEGVGAIRIPVPGSSVRRCTPPKDDGRRKREKQRLRMTGEKKGDNAQG